MFESTRCPELQAAQGRSKRVAVEPPPAECEQERAFGCRLDVMFQPSLPIRVVEMCAGGLQIQERVTVQVGDWITQHLQPRSVGVVIEAEPVQDSQGVRAQGARTLSSSLHVLVRDDPRTRSEFPALTRAAQ
jgi:hypothetical protein